MCKPCTKRHYAGGFTLIELLVAVSIMALMSIMAWRALDGMQNTSTQSRTHTDAVLTVESGLAQWVADLDNLQELANTTPLDWNGRALRITRRHSSDPTQGLLVVAWARNPRSLGDGIDTDLWLRWQSAPVRTRQAWQTAWRNAALWAENQNPAEQSREVAIAPLQKWQIYYFRGGAWSNPLSSADTPSAPPVSAAPLAAPSPADSTANATSNVSLPDGVRLVLTLAPPHPLAGVLTRDWSRATNASSTGTTP